jgi:hypothetical protein
MPQVFRGLFYEFHTQRVISRAGQPIVSVPGLEIGRQISREEAVRQVRGGRDVYTLFKEDAYKLASQLYAQKAVEEPAHRQLYYAHFHPGGEHPELDRERPGRPKTVAGPGHVFFGERGKGF